MAMNQTAKRIIETRKMIARTGRLPWQVHD